MSKPLKGKAVVITGAAAGLGAAYARHAAEAGAAVVLADICDADDLAAEIIAKGGEALAIKADISRWQANDELVTACLDHFGRFDGFVANAGILRPARLEQMAEAELREMIEVNLIGAAAGLQAALRGLKGRQGSIVMVTSGSQAGDLMLGGYAATKGAVASLTYAAAMEMRGTKVRVNAISPLAQTAMATLNAPLLAAQSEVREVKYGILPPPEVSAPLVSWLLSDRSVDVTGQVIRLAGEELSLVSHPMIARPFLKGTWDFDAIDQAFTQKLQSAQQRLGVCHMLD